MPGEDSVSVRREMAMMANAVHQPTEMKSDHGAEFITDHPVVKEVGSGDL